jgi:trigger factor
VASQVEELEGNRIRLTVDVPTAEMEHAVEHAASDLAGSLRIPGFRKGKVPMPVLVARVGRERLFAEAIDSHISGWFWNAAARSRVRPVTQPEYEYDPPASSTEPFTFTATFEVQPMPEVADWTQLEVPAPEAIVPEDAIDHELDVLRSSVAELAPVEGRPVKEGDTLVIDLVSPGGEVQHDYVVELGGGRLVEELEHALLGMEAGETKDVGFELADGGDSSVGVTVKEIKEKVLPPLDDDLARTASEFDTLAELRADIEARLREQLEDEIESQVRAAAADALVEASNVEAAGPLVETRAAQLWDGLVRSLANRGISAQTYFQISGRDPAELQEALRAEARQAVARELVLEAVAEKLELEITDDEVRDLIREQAEAVGDDPDEMIEHMFHSSGAEQLREDLRLRAALDRVAAEVKRIPVELARARESIWTPEQEKPDVTTKLWTPGSKEPA